MTIDKLKRVMWRVRTMYPERKYVTLNEIERAIMIECGTYPETVFHNRKALLKIHWIRRWKHGYLLTGKDITEDF